MSGKLQDLKKRFVFSIFAILIASLLIIYSQFPLVKIFVTFTISILALVAMLEYVEIVAKKELILPKVTLALATLFIVLSFFLSSQMQNYKPLIVFCFFSCLVLLFCFRFKEIQGSLTYIALSSFGLLYIAFPMGLLFTILYTGDGRFWIAYLLIVTKVTDMGGYFGGRFFGKRQLSIVSPKKTKEGAVIGILCAVIFSLIFTIICNPYGFLLKPTSSLILGLILGIFGQVGDLAESLIKRDAKVKDSSNLPGLGGILDMFDSLLFNIPILYLFLEVFK
jgi:phosphatidate cytidylyltransferase